MRNRQAFSCFKKALLDCHYFSQGFNTPFSHFKISWFLELWCTNLISIRSPEHQLYCTVCRADVVALPSLPCWEITERGAILMNRFSFSQHFFILDQRLVHRLKICHLIRLVYTIIVLFQLQVRKLSYLCWIRSKITLFNPRKTMTPIFTDSTGRSQWIFSICLWTNYLFEQKVSVK